MEPCVRYRGGKRHRQLTAQSVTRPLTYVRQNAYRQITAEEKVVAAAPVYRWLTRQTPGVLRQLEREFVTDDHRLWPKDAPEQPQQMPTPLPQKTWQKIGERMQTDAGPCGTRRRARAPMH